jgi:hypothetical protein
VEGKIVRREAMVVKARPFLTSKLSGRFNSGARSVFLTIKIICLRTS